MIIGILGKAGSGKDTVADILVKNHGFVKIAFADPIKRFCMDVFDFSEEQMWGASEFRSEIDERYGITPRLLLQRVGTEGVRSCYEDAWVEYAIRKAKLVLSDPKYRYDKVKGVYEAPIDSVMTGLPLDEAPKGVVISDCRFENEVQLLKDAGGTLVKINRDSSGLAGSAARHRSEMEQEGIPDSTFDAVINNNTTLKALKEEAAQLLWFCRRVRWKRKEII